MRTIFNSFLILVFSLSRVISQPNYDETKVPVFKLPPILVDQNNRKIISASEWNTRRRNEILSLLIKEEYGRIPDGNVKTSFRVLHEKSGVLEGMADRKEVEMEFSGNGKKITSVLLVYLPAGMTKPVPVFLGYNFNGNHAVFPDPGISRTNSWVRNNVILGVVNNVSTESSRGGDAGDYPILNILARGYGFATLYYGDIDPDFDDGFENGIQPLFYKTGQGKPAVDEWGSIGAWAWGLSRTLDYLETDIKVDAGKVAVFGHSRLGKTSLWAGAIDPRFALVISNDSGCGGAALSKRKFGETVERINTAFPHWFCDNFNRYNNNEEALTFDQHMLLSLIAPRPLYVASAANDLWADPKGEYLSLYHAGEVYRLLGSESIDVGEMPEINHPLVIGSTGYHIRSGEHALTFYDWDQYLNFADNFLK